MIIVALGCSDTYAGYFLTKIVARVQYVARIAMSYIDDDDVVI